VTADKLSLSLLRFLRAPCDDVVVILHGLTTSSDMFTMPEHYNLVQYLRPWLHRRGTLITV
jgi:cholesterol oxidase